MKRILLLLTVYLVCHNLLAQTRTWDGGGSTNDWGEAANWDPDDVPDSAGERAIITGSASVDLTTSINIGSLEIQNGSSLTITGTLQINGSPALLTINGDIVNNNSASNSFIIFTTGSATIDGTGFISGQSFGVTALSGITVSSGSSLDFELETSFGNTLTIDGATLTFNNTGSTADPFVTFSNNISSATGSTLNFTGSDANDLNVQIVTAPTFGNLVFNHSGSGVVDFNSDFNIEGNLTNTNGFSPNSIEITFNGSSAQTIDGTITFDEVVFDNTTSVTLLGTGEMTILTRLNNIDGFRTADGSKVNFGSDGTEDVTLSDTEASFNLTFHDVEFNVNSNTLPSGGIEVTGDFTNTNGFEAEMDEVEFNGTDEQNITGNPIFYRVTFNNNTNNITLGSSISVEENFTNTAGFNANGQIVNFNGNVIQTISGSSTITFANVNFTNTSGSDADNPSIELNEDIEFVDASTVTLDNGVIVDANSVSFGNSSSDDVDLTMNGNSILVISQSAVVPEFGGTYTLSSGSTIDLRDATAQSSNGLTTGITYGNVTISSGARNQGGSGDVTIQSGSTFTIADGATYRMASGEEITGDGDFTLASGGTLEIGDNAGISSDANPTDGNIQVTGTKSYNSSANYVYAGGVNDQNTGNGLPSTINGTLTISKTNSGGAPDTVNLDQPTTISSSGTLFIEAGILNTESNDITVDASSPIEGTGNGTATSDFSSTNHIEGPITTSGLGTASFVFPVGDAGDYRPVTITPASSGDFTVQHFTDTATGLGTDLGLGGTFESFLSSRFWNIQGLGSVDADVTFQVEEAADNQANSFDDMELNVVSNTGGTWQDIGQPTASGSPTATITINILAAEFGGDFTLASTDFNINPLPVEFLSFVGKQIGSNIRLEWATATEIDNEKFEIEHHTGEGEFTKIGLVPGNGDSDEVIEYRYVHNNPALGANFYRLKQIDFDGDFDYSDIIRVWFEQAGDFDFEVFPNPASENMSVRFGKNIPASSVVEVLSLSGQSMMRQTLGSDGDEINLNVGNLSKGLYILQVNTGNEVFKSRIIKE